MSSGHRIFRYWERRHARNLEDPVAADGAGSSEELIRYKAALVQELIEATNATSLLDAGCGTGRLAERLEVDRYLGLDVSETARAETRRRIEGRSGWSVLDNVPKRKAGSTFDMAISMDVVQHLIHEEAFRRHIGLLFRSSRTAVGIYTPNREESEESAPHVRFRDVKSFVNNNYQSWSLSRSVPGANPEAAEWMVWLR